MLVDWVNTPPTDRREWSSRLYRPAGRCCWRVGGFSLAVQDDWIPSGMTMMEWYGTAIEEVRCIMVWAVHPRQ